MKQVVISNSTEIKPRNQTFQFLKALLIIMVVDDHCGQKLGLMTSIFPYNSFYMPMFMFVSGYFFKETNTFWTNTKRATKKVLIPYLLWSFVGWGIAFGLTFAGLNWCSEITINKWIELLFLNPLVTINGPMWYAITYFWVFILYSLINVVVKGRNSILKESVIFASMLSIGATILFLCRNGWLGYNYTFLNYRLFIARTLFYLPFFHFGYMFHRFIERIFDKSPKLLWGVAIACVSINLVISLVFGSNNMVFVSSAGMSSFKSDWLPFVTSITGILFWYSIMRALSNTVGRIGLINVIADNTFTIMAIHLLMADIPGFIAYAQVLKGKTIQGFDVQAFIGSAWYRYYENANLYYAFFCGLFGSLFVAIFLLYVKRFREHLHVGKVFSKSSK